MSRRFEPKQSYVEAAIAQSVLSTCKSKRGIAIWNDDGLIAAGYNAAPAGFPCNSTCGKLCARQAIHAEMRAILAADGRQRGADMLHVKTINGALVTSDGPSCVQCSKYMLESGIAGMWLFHQGGWLRYPIVEFHALSLSGDTR